MNLKIIATFFILQGISILSDAVLNIFNKEFFKYMNYELPDLFNYISFVIGILFFACGIGILFKNKIIYKLSLVLSVLFTIYLIVNSIFILYNGIQIGILIINIIFILIYLFIIKNLNLVLRSN